MSDCHARRRSKGVVMWLMWMLVTLLCHPTATATITHLRTAITATSESNGATISNSASNSGNTIDYQQQLDHSHSDTRVLNSIPPFTTESTTKSTTVITTQQLLNDMTDHGKWMIDNELRMFSGLSKSDSTNDRRNSAYECPQHNTNSYFWKSDQYDMLRFQPYLLCKEMRGRPLAISGDVSSHTFFETIVNAMSIGSVSDWKRRQRVKLPSKTDIVKRSLKKQKIYGTVFNDVCVQNGFLPFEMVMFDSPLLDFDGGVWETWLANHTNAVVVLNKGGTKYVDDARLRNSLMETFPKYLKLLSENESSVLIWRTNQIAHADCEAYDRPLRSTQYKASMLAESPGHHELHLKDMPLQSERVVKPVVENLIRKFSPSIAHLSNRFLYMDILPSAKLRPDRHRKDCFLYCIPGPVESWVSFLLNTLAVVNREVGGV